ncbi:MAG TPA: hypothetical protein ENK18_22275 [Deltaproteobacteria bacterium]|nr:hypothetical protein [Deltaproteobacteria bacterium]
MDDLRDALDDLRRQAALRSTLRQRTEEAVGVREAAHEAWAVACKAQVDLDRAQRGLSAWAARLLGQLEPRLSTLRLAARVAHATFEEIEARRVTLDEELSSLKLALVPLEDAPQRLIAARIAAQEHLLAEGHPTLAAQLERLHNTEATLEALHTTLRLGRGARTELAGIEVELASDPELSASIPPTPDPDRRRGELARRIVRTQAALDTFTRAAGASSLPLSQVSRDRIAYLGGLSDLAQARAAGGLHSAIRQAMGSLEPAMEGLQAALRETRSSLLAQRNNLDLLLLSTHSPSPDELNTFPRFSSIRGD